MAVWQDAATSCRWVAALVVVVPIHSCWLLGRQTKQEASGATGRREIVTLYTAVCVRGTWTHRHLVDIHTYTYTRTQPGHACAHTHSHLSVLPYPHRQRLKPHAHYCIPMVYDHNTTIPYNYIDHQHAYIHLNHYGQRMKYLGFVNNTTIAIIMQNSIDVAT